MYRESEVVELKEKYVDTIVRDIVAFLNANGGDIFVRLLFNSDKKPRSRNRK